MVSLFLNDHGSADPGELIELAIRESRKKKRRGIGANYYENRLFSPKYVRNLKRQSGIMGQHTVEPVVRRLSNGTGSSSLRDTMRYIMRDHDYQREQGERQFVMYDVHGNEITPDNLDETLEQWRTYFYEADERRRTQNVEHAIYLKNRIGNLNNEQFENTERDPEQDRKVIEKGYLPDDIWSQGTLVRLYDDNENREDKRIRHVRNNRDGEIYLDGETQARFKDELHPIQTKQGFNIREAGNKEQDYTAKDDKHYVIEGVKKHTIDKLAPNDFHHVILSPGGNPDKETAFRATKEYLDKNFYERGFDYVMGMHDDTENLHFHVIFNAHNFLIKDYPFPKTPHESFIMRQEYADTLDYNGIDRVATMHKDRPKPVDLAEDKVDRLKTLEERYYSYFDEDKKAFNPLPMLANWNDQYDASVEKIISKLHDRIGAKATARLLDELDEMKDAIDIFNREKLPEYLEGVANWLEMQDQQAAETWRNEMTLENIIEDNPDKKKYRDELRIQAQKKQQARYERTYQGLLYLKEVAETDEQLIDIFELEQDIADLSIQIDSFLSETLNREQKYLDRADMYIEMEKSYNRLKNQNKEKERDDEGIDEIKMPLP